MRSSVSIRPGYTSSMYDHEADKREINVKFTVNVKIIMYTGTTRYRRVNKLYLCMTVMFCDDIHHDRL